MFRSSLFVIVIPKKSADIGAPRSFRFSFKYINKLWITTQPGYSISVLPPAGHYDLPFLQIPAVIDTDAKDLTPTPFPVWIKSGFEGIVEKGTPIAQVIPFKRESWHHEISVTENDNEYNYSLNKWKTKIGHQYIKSAWSKKRYE
jgi:hypothetical protein